MAQSLLVLQSLWAMERCQPDGMEWTLDEKLEKIIAAGFYGVSSVWVDRQHAKHVASVIKPHGQERSDFSWKSQNRPKL